MCTSHTLAHVSGRKCQEGLPTTHYVGPGWPAYQRGEAKDLRREVPESENRTQMGERTGSLAEFRSSRYVTMLAASKLAKVASLVNRGDPCS
jgi:hypothetical protein